MKIKPQLLECLIRVCVNEVLTQMHEGEDDIKGAAAPPMDGQGTGDQPEMDTDDGTPDGPEEKNSDEPSKKETPETDKMSGILFINPVDKTKLQKIKPPTMNDASLERALYALASSNGGQKVKIALSTVRAVKDAAKNPSAPLYLYIGKYDPSSEELFLLADKSLQVARDASNTESETSSEEGGEVGFNPIDADASQFAQHMNSGGRTEPTGLDEEVMAIIKKMIREVIYSKK